MDDMKLAGANGAGAEAWTPVARPARRRSRPRRRLRKQAQVLRRVAGFWMRATGATALWMVSACLLMRVFSSTTLAYLGGFWIALNGAFVINAVVATLWKDRE
jgi:hypothetical protein